MIDFIKACEKAQTIFLKRGYRKGIAEICDLGDRWLFVGSRFEQGAVDYGNGPIAISKETGESEDYQFSLLDNLKLYYSSDDVLIPKEFELS